MEYWILWDAAQLESQLWHMASSLSVQWPQNKLLKVQNVPKFTAYVQSVLQQYFSNGTWLCDQNCLGISSKSQDR